MWPVSCLRVSRDWSLYRVGSWRSARHQQGIFRIYFCLHVTHLCIATQCQNRCIQSQCLSAASGALTPLWSVSAALRSEGLYHPETNSGAFEYGTACLRAWFQHRGDPQSIGILFGGGWDYSVGKDFSECILSKIKCRLFLIFWCLFLASRCSRVFPHFNDHYGN